jgi:hypothetical protein
MAGKYTPLENYLAVLPPRRGEVRLSFEHIERILNGRLPPSSKQYNAWWSNETEGSHVQAHAWMDAGWKVDAVNFREKWVRFVRQKLIVSPSRT